MNVWSTLMLAGAITSLGCDDNTLETNAAPAPAERLAPLAETETDVQAELRANPLVTYRPPDPNEDSSQVIMDREPPKPIVVDLATVAAQARARMQAPQFPVGPTSVIEPSHAAAGLRCGHDGNSDRRSQADEQPRSATKPSSRWDEARFQSNVPLDVRLETLEPSDLEDSPAARWHAENVAPTAPE